MKLINLGHYSEGGTPVPISNTAVKSSSAYGTSGLPWWESRSWPSLMLDIAITKIEFFVCFMITIVIEFFFILYS